MTGPNCSCLTALQICTQGHALIGLRRSAVGSSLVTICWLPAMTHAVSNGAPDVDSGLSTLHGLLNDMLAENKLHEEQFGPAPAGPRPAPSRAPPAPVPGCSPLPVQKTLDAPGFFKAAVTATVSTGRSTIKGEIDFSACSDATICKVVKMLNKDKLPKLIVDGSFDAQMHKFAHLMLSDTMHALSQVWHHTRIHLSMVFAGFASKTCGTWPTSTKSAQARC